MIAQSDCAEHLVRVENYGPLNVLLLEFSGHHCLDFVTSELVHGIPSWFAARGSVPRAQLCQNLAGTLDI